MGALTGEWPLLLAEKPAQEVIGTLRGLAVNLMHGGTDLVGGMSNA